MDRVKRKVCCIILILLIFCSNSSAIELKTQYENTYPLYFSVGQDDIQRRQIIGLCIEIIEAVKKEIPDLRIVPASQMASSLEIRDSLAAGKIDISFCIEKNEKTAETIGYIDPPLYEVHDVMATDMHEKVLIDSFADFKILKGNKSIVVPTNSTVKEYLLKQKDLDIRTLGVDLSSSLQTLLVDQVHYRMRFVYFHDLGLINTIKRDFLHKDLKLFPSSFRTYFHYVAYSKKLPQHLVESLRSAVDKISKNKVLSTIYSKYTVKH